MGTDDGSLPPGQALSPTWEDFVPELKQKAVQLPKMSMRRNSRIHWILVTGAADNLSPEEVEAANQVGAMLAREGYGLIVGDWHGVDWLVKAAFLEALPGHEQPARIKHVANYREGELVRVPRAEVLEDDGPNTGYSRSAILAADAGIIVSGRKGSKPSMDALLRHQKPVLPVAFLGWDAFEIYRDILADWNERPVQGLTERQFLELMKPWRRNPQTIARTLRASLATEPEIFISYRRGDVPAAAGRVFDELAHAYGQRSVFIDYANLTLGEDLERILLQLRRCKVLVTMIGPNWRPDRLHQEGDYVRREIEAAKQANLSVIPLLVSRTTPPPREEIPETLAFLWELNFATLQMNDWASSIRRLKEAVDKAIFE